MPIATTLSALQAQLSSSQNTGIAGNPSLTSTQIAAAVSAVAPAGLIMVGIIPTPLVPAGFTAMQQLLQSSFNSGVAGTPSLTSQQIANAVSVLCPLVPPIGLPVLQSLLLSMSNMGLAGSSDMTAQMFASAIIAYFTSGTVI